MKKNNKSFYWVIGLLGPIISTLLDNVFIKTNSKILSGIVYSGGFVFFICSLFFSYRIQAINKKTDLLKEMIKSITYFENGQVKEERGYIDNNSVEAIKVVKSI